MKNVINIEKQNILESHDEIKSLIREFNEELLGKNIIKVIHHTESNAACIVTDENVIEIVRDTGLSEGSIMFNLKELEGKCIERINIEAHSNNSLVCKISAKDLKTGITTEIPNAITMENPDVTERFLVIFEYSQYRLNYSEAFDFSEIIGETIIDIIGGQGDAELTLKMANGYNIVLYHQRECHEDVYLYDVEGNLEDLIGTPLVQADESTSEGERSEGSHTSYTWTFYKFATAKGFVTLRWLGSSNGYYSESVDIAIEPRIDETYKKVYLH